MKEFGIPYSEWGRIPMESDDRRIGYNELLAYMAEENLIMEEKKKEAEEEAEEKTREIRGQTSLRQYGSTYRKPRKMVKAVSSIE